MVLSLGEQNIICILSLTWHQWNQSTGSGEQVNEKTQPKLRARQDKHWRRDSSKLIEEAIEEEPDCQIA